MPEKLEEVRSSLTSMMPMPMPMPFSVLRSRAKLRVVTIKRIIDYLNIAQRLTNRSNV